MMMMMMGVVKREEEATDAIHIDYQRGRSHDI